MRIKPFIKNMCSFRIKSPVLIYVLNIEFKTGVISLKSKKLFDVRCGVCGGKMTYLENSCFFVCDGCNEQRDGNFLKKFLEEKYVGEIKKIEITGLNSAKIFLNGKNHK